MAVDEQVMDGFEGSGIFESYASLVDATTNGAQNDAAEVGLAAAGAGLDTLGMVIDPLGTVLGAGVGWLLEHLSPFSEFLDLLAGDPDAVEATSTTLTGEADRIGGFAEAQGAAVAGLTQWSGESADGFRRRMDDLKQLIASLGEIVRGTGELVQMMGQAVAAVRGLIRDIIAEVIGGLIAGALVAAGLMPFTFGTSIAVFIGTAIGVVAGTVARIVKFVQKLTALVTRFAGRAGDLGRLSDEIAEIMARNSTDVPTPTPTPGDSPRSITPTPEANDVTAPPPASVAPPPNQSPTPDINNSGPTPTPNSGPTPEEFVPDFPGQTPRTIDEILNDIEADELAPSTDVPAGKQDFEDWLQNSDVRNDPDFRSSDADRQEFRDSYPEYDDALRDVAAFKEKNPQYADIPDEDLASIIAFTGSRYHEEMNLALRNGDADALDRLEPNINTMTSGLNQLPPFQGPVFRGADLDNVAAGNEAATAYTPGGRVTESAFTSTSPDRPFIGHLNFEINSLTGRDISGLSSHGYENEVVFPPGTEFDVIGKTQGPDGKWTIQLSEVPR